ncbi:MAG TPA: GNAT family N-acetyltransferase [Longimicrobium sp.]
MIIYAGDVFLRPYQACDEACIAGLLMDPEVMSLALDERALSKEEAHAFIQKNFGPPTEPCMEVVCLRRTAEPIGFAGYRPCGYLLEKDIELGFVLAKEHWRKGYATAIGKRLILHAQHGLGLSRILAACHPQNSGSNRVLGAKLRMLLHKEDIVVPRAEGETRRNVYVVVFPNTSLSPPERLD